MYGKCWWYSVAYITLLSQLGIKGISYRKLISQKKEDLSFSYILHKHEHFLSIFVNKCLRIIEYILYAWHEYSMLFKIIIQFIKQPLIINKYIHC